MSHRTAPRRPAGLVVVCALAAMAITLGGNLTLGLLAATHDPTVTARTLAALTLVIASAGLLIFLAKMACRLRSSYRGQS